MYEADFLAVDICKNMLKKATEKGGDFNVYLLNYRNNPLSGFSYSPAQILQSRRLRTLINNFNDKCLEPVVVVNASEQMYKNKERQIIYYNKNAENVEDEFYPDEKILIQNRY